MLLKASVYNNFLRFGEKDYLYNARSGFFCEPDPECISYIQNIENNNKPEKYEFYQLLLDKGVIVPANVDEYNYFVARSLTEQNSIKQDTLNFVIATTRNCNYNCVYCFEGKIHENMNMTPETQKKTVEFIISQIEKAGCKKLHITWFGGEPLLNTDCIEYISSILIDYCDDNDIVYDAGIITNGSMLDRKTSRLLSMYKVSSVQVTIDGDCGEYCIYKGTTPTNFEKMINGILLLPAHVKLLVRFNTDADNYFSVKKVAVNLIDRMSEERKKNCVMYLAPIEGTSSMRIRQRLLNIFTEDFLKTLMIYKMKDSILGNLPQPRFVSCGAIKRGNYAIDSNGNLVKCEHYIGNDKMACGTVFDGPDYNENEMKFFAIPVPEKCKACSYFPVCSGGCAQRRCDKDISVECKEFIEKIHQILAISIGAA